MNARVIPIEPDTGTAYGRPKPTHRAELAEVGAGTTMGELMRRYWHPIGMAADATDTPRRIRVLGEDLILFRDGQGRLACCTHTARTAARRCTTARSTHKASAAATTAGCSTCRAIAWSSPASPKAGAPATGAASPGIRCRNSTA